MDDHEKDLALARAVRLREQLLGLAGRYPEDQALRAFLAMALYNRGEGREAVGLLLKTLATASDDPGVRQYRRAIEHYADDLDAVEPG